MSFRRIAAESSEEMGRGENPDKTEGEEKERRTRAVEKESKVDHTHTRFARHTACRYTKYTHTHIHTYDGQANVIEADRVDIVMRRYLSRYIIVQSAIAAAAHCTPLRFRERAPRHGTIGIYTIVTRTVESPCPSRATQRKRCI